jgi:hypothetical protein
MAGNVKLGFGKNDAVRAVWAFLAPFVVVFVAGMLGIVNTLVTSCTTKCDLSAAKAAGIALVIAVASSILVSLKNFTLANNSKLKG